MRFPSYYGARRARLEQGYPTDWLILPDNGWYKLVQLEVLTNDKRKNPATR